MSVTHDGKQYLLVPGPDTPENRAAAEAAHQKLIEETARRAAAEAVRLLSPAPQPPVPGAVPVPTCQTVAEAAAGFLAHHDKRAAVGKIEAKSLANYRRTLVQLAEAFGGRPVSSLTADELEQWADRPDWSASYQHNSLGTVAQLLRWAGVALKLRRPPKESRGAETCLTDEQFDQVLAHACRYKVKGDLRELLQVLRETGARPQEIAPLMVDRVDWANACTVLRKHKTRKKTGKDRAIHFNTAAMRILTAQRERYGEGLLFRTRRGGHFKPDSIVERLQIVSQRVGFRVTAYGLGRHSFATRALEHGVPDAIVAELLGHKGTGMLHRHYSHLSERARVLKDAAEKASRRPAAG